MKYFILSGSMLQYYKFTVFCAQWNWVIQTDAVGRVRNWPIYFNLDIDILNVCPLFPNTM